MKNFQLNQKPFAAFVFITTNKLSKSTNNDVRTFKTIVLLIIAIAFLLSTTSCSNNVSSGCGTWQVAKYKKSNEYNSYKKYN